jgi:hypothetical protein
MFYCIVIIHVNAIIIKLNDLVRHVSTGTRHLPVTLKRNEVFGYCIYTTLLGMCLYWIVLPVDGCSLSFVFCFSFE